MGYVYDLLCEDESKGFVEKLLCEEGEGEGKVYKRKGFIKTRSGFIVFAVVLLEEIFGLLGIEEMEVSGYALAEGVIAEVFAGFDSNANARWRSVSRLAWRFKNKKMMMSVARASIAQIIKKAKERDEDPLSLSARFCEELDRLAQV